MALGFSFAPGSDIQMNGQNGGGTASPSRLTPQQAVKILSLRVPESLPGNAPVARQLLTAPGGSAAGASGLQSLIQQLIQSFRPQPQQGGQLPSQSMPFTPTQAPQTGPSQNVSQQPVYQGDVPTDPMFHPMVGGGGRPGGGEFGNNWMQGVQSWANQSMQPGVTLPRFTIGEDLFGSGVAQNRNA